jgi:hypothetical protein
MARIPLTWYPGPGTWHHSHISNLNKALANGAWIQCEIAGAEQECLSPNGG